MWLPLLCLFLVWVAIGLVVGIVIGALIGISADD